MAYGEARANCEAEASWTDATIIRELQAQPAGYTTSTWGQNHVNATQLFVAQGLNHYRPVFIAQPHEANKPATDYMGLPTREMYAYKGSVLLGGTTKSLDNPAVYTVSGIRYSTVKILKLAVGEPWLNQINTTKPDTARAVYRGVTDFLASKPTLVTWAHGNNSADWVFSNAMKQCKPIGDFADVTNKMSGIDVGTMRQPDKEKLKYT